MRAFNVLLPSQKKKKKTYEDAKRMINCGQRDDLIPLLEEFKSKERWKKAVPEFICQRDECEVTLQLFK